MHHFANVQGVLPHRASLGVAKRIRALETTPHARRCRCGARTKPDVKTGGAQPGRQDGSGSKPEQPPIPTSAPNSAPSLAEAPKLGPTPMPDPRPKYEPTLGATPGPTPGHPHKTRRRDRRHAGACWVAYARTHTKTDLAAHTEPNPKIEARMPETSGTLASTQACMQARVQTHTHTHTSVRARQAASMLQSGLRAEGAFAARVDHIAHACGQARRACQGLAQALSPKPPWVAYLLRISGSSVVPLLLPARSSSPISGLARFL